MIIEANINDLIPAPNNPRIHDKKQINELKKSLQKFGQYKPIVINNEGVILAGNGVFQAAKSLGWKTIKTVKVDLPEEEQKKLMLADNQLSAIGYTDFTILDQIIADIAQSVSDIDIPGFSADDFKHLFPDRPLLGDIIEEESTKEPRPEREPEPIIAQEEVVEEVEEVEEEEDEQKSETEGWITCPNCKARFRAKIN